MTDVNSVWKSILQMDQPTENKVEAPIPQQQTPAIQLPGLGDLLKTAIETPKPQPANPQLQTTFSTGPAPIINQGTNQVAALEVIESDDEDDDDDNDLDDLENELDLDETIDTAPIQNSFSLSLPNATAPTSQPQFGIDLNTFNVSPQTNVQPVKRGRGRPPKAQTAQDVINLLPNQLVTEDDKSKSNINPQTTVSQIKQSSTEVVISIPKKTFKDLGESLARIAATFNELGQ